MQVVLKALGTFQRAMDVFLSIVEAQFALRHLQIIGTIAKSAGSHADQARQVMTLLNYTGLALSLNNLEFLTNRID